MKKTVLFIEELPAHEEAGTAGVARAPEGLGPVDYVDMTWEQRCKPRHRLVTAGGAEIVLSLPRGTQLYNGTVLYKATDATIAVRAKPEPLVSISPRDMAEACRVAHHLGNWHRSLETTGDCLYAQIDSPLEEWLSKCGIQFQRCSRPFNPNLRSHAH